MRWYVNDASLQGQYADAQSFEILIRGIIRLRSALEVMRLRFFTSHTFRDRLVSPTRRVREVVQSSSDADFRRAVLSWLDRNGPFVEGDRLHEGDDYFEYSGLDVTDTGLGEATRRKKANEDAASFSFVGGAIPFDLTPLLVDHGLCDDRLGCYEVDNCWTLEQLEASGIGYERPASSWKELVESARRRFPRLIIPDNIYQDQRLSREPFNAAIRDRALVLLSRLDLYMSDRTAAGAEGEIARSVINNFFTGERALFTGESPSNIRDFAQELTFPDPLNADQAILAHWHGKISHRFFRMHFEWPVPAGRGQLKVLYLGPKLTKG